MDPLTQICGGSVIDIFPLGPPGAIQKPNFVVFHNRRREILISFNNDGSRHPNLWGSVIDTFLIGPPGTVQKPNFAFFHNGRREISISVNNDGPLDPNLWGVGN